MKKRTVGIIILSLSLLSLNGCGKDADSSQGSVAADPNKVVIDEPIVVGNTTGNTDGAAGTGSEEDTSAVGTGTEATDGTCTAWFTIYDSIGKPDKVINIEAYQKKCPDVYAYIEIPGTDISYPIAYCEDQLDPYWFTHDIDGNESDSAMIITDSANNKDFSDPITLVYGQNPDNGTMFHDLHKFRDADFFDKHDTVNIYLDGGELIYKIYTAYIGSNENMLYYTDFSDPAAFSKYFEDAEATRDLSINVREDERPDFNDHVIILVTHCDDDNKRMIVQAVLSDVKY